jgi:hypothetical protein
MNRLEFSAGRFKIACYTDGYPLRAELDDGERTIRIEGRELKDLEYIFERMRNAMRKHYLRPGYNMENEALGLE